MVLCGIIDDQSDPTVTQKCMTLHFPTLRVIGELTSAAVDLYN